MRVGCWLFYSSNSKTMQWIALYWSPGLRMEVDRSKSDRFYCFAFYCHIALDFSSNAFLAHCWELHGPVSKRRPMQRWPQWTECYIKVSNQNCSTVKFWISKWWSFVTVVTDVALSVNWSQVHVKDLSQNLINVRVKWSFRHDTLHGKATNSQWLFTTRTFWRSIHRSTNVKQRAVCYSSISHRSATSPRDIWRWELQ